MAFGLNTGSVNGGLAHLLLEFCQHEGITPPKACVQFHPADRIPFQVWQQLLNDIQQQYQKPGMGLAIARLAKPSHVGVIAYLGLACQTLGEAMQRFANYHRLAYDGNDMQVIAQNGHIAIRWGIGLGKPGQLADETAIALFVQMARQLVQPEYIHLTRIQFVNQKPANKAVYEQHFQCPVDFDCEQTSVIFPLQTLSIPLNQADTTLKQLLESQAKALLAELPAHDQFDLQVQEHLTHAVHQGMITIEDLADKMGMSVRGLQRALQAHGYNFQQRLAQVRETMAKQYLQDAALSLTDIALLLAYSEQSAFQRAFKQWTGKTPKAWRADHSTRCQT